MYLGHLITEYYRRFIPDFSKLSLPPTKLLNNNTPIHWTSGQQKSFETLKKTLTTGPLLQYPDFSKKFHLSIDASDFTIGTVLSQGEPGNVLPIAYVSRTLNKSESNYSTMERELSGIVWAVKYFRPYLYRKRFTIFTDNHLLKWLINIKEPISRLVCWRLVFEEYDYSIEYRPRQCNQNADALCRIKSENPIEIHKINSNHRITYSEFCAKLRTSIFTYDKLQECSTYFFDSNNLI